MEVLIYAIPLALLYVLVLRPNKKKMASRETMVLSLSVGDAVITIGGLHGVIVEIPDDQTLILRVEDGTLLRFDRRSMGHTVSSDDKSTNEEDES